MKRICIFSIYDAEGIIDTYIKVNLDSLVKAVARLIIVVNGKLLNEGYNELKRFSSEIVLRNNEGFDVGAYREILLEYLSYDELLEYDELVLSNDTYFGPFISFEDIFGKMGKRECDFWGLSYIQNGVLSHMQSYFLVFYRNVFESLISYFRILPEKFLDKLDVCVKFEHGLFSHLVEKDYTYAYFSGVDCLDIYANPDVAIEKYGLPILKKRCFDKTCLREKNIHRALELIDAEYGYDCRLICEVADRKYNCLDRIRTMDECTDEIKLYSRNKIMVESEDISEFCKNNKAVYILGAGYYGRKLGWLFRNEEKIKGYIVFRVEENPNTIDGLKVYGVSEVDNTDVGIIVALSKENTEQIKEKLSQFKRILFLWD